MNNKTAIIGSSPGGKIAYSHAITLYGIPVIYFEIAALLILVILYLLCRLKRKDCHHVMKKSSYLKLFIICFAIIFFLNLFSGFNDVSSNHPIPLFLIIHGYLFLIIALILVSLVESIFPYLIIVLSILIINCFRKSS